MPTDALEPDDVPTVRASVIRAAMTPRQGTTVLFEHHPDGTVTAASRGLVGHGRTTGEALADLERRFNVVLPDG
jgi:hypothetical protein